MASRGLPGFLRRSIRSAGEESDASEETERFDEDDRAADTDGVVEQDRHASSQPTEQTLPTSTTEQHKPSASGSNGINNSSERSEGSRNVADLAMSGPKNSTTTSLLSDSWHEVSPPTAQSEESTDKKKSYREGQFEKILSSDVVNMEELRKLAWNGIPHCYRATVWKILLGYLPTNAARREQALQRKRAEYVDAIAQHYDIDDDSRTLQEQETLRQVLVDVPRTQPNVPLFRNDRIKRILSRLLYIWACR